MEKNCVNCGCNEVIQIDREFARLDGLTRRHQSIIDGLAKEKSNLQSRKNTLMHQGCCQPIEQDDVDLLTGKVIGKKYTHNTYCQHKTTKLEVR